MACYHPLKAWPVGYHDSGKLKYTITNYMQIGVKNAIGDPIEIPCRKCIGCRLRYSREWADRCMLELKYHEQSWFVTFTYDDEHLPKNYIVDEETGEVVPSATLVKRDIQLFMKRLRKNYKYDNDIRYFFAGEYGSQTYRPHYHAILFGLKLDDLKLYKQSEDGYNYYNSAFLDKCWQYQGHVVVGCVTWDTCAYTARYIMKKQYGSAAEIYERYNIQPEFTLMSRKPAIGRKYYDEHKETIFDSDFIYIGTEDGSHSIKPPRYYERLFDIDYPDEYVKMKEQKKEFMEDMKKLRMENTSLPYLEQLAVDELNKEKALSALPRKEI